MLGFSQTTIVDQAKYERFLKEAETASLLRELKANAPRKRNHLLSACGDLLIAAGQRLKTEQPSKMMVSGS